MVDKVRFASLKDRAYCILDEVVWRQRRVHLEGDVGYRLAQRAFYSQNRTRNATVVRSDVEVRERVRNHAIDSDPESAEFAI